MSSWPARRKKTFWKVHVIGKRATSSSLSSFQRVASSLLGILLPPRTTPPTPWLPSRWLAPSPSGHSWPRWCPHRPAAPPPLSHPPSSYDRQWQIPQQIPNPNIDYAATTLESEFPTVNLTCQWTSPFARAGVARSWRDQPYTFCSENVAAGEFIKEKHVHS
jgi:hypothetical protein